MSRVLRAQVRLLQVLNWNHGLETWLAGVALLRATVVLTHHPGVQAQYLDSALIVLVGVRYVAYGWNWWKVRCAKHALAFAIWGEMAVHMGTADLPGASVLGCIALGELMVFLRVLLRLDCRENPVGVRLRQPDAMATLTTAQGAPTDVQGPD